MLAIFVSTPAIIYYCLVFLCEYATRYGLYKYETDHKNKYLKLSTFLSLLAIGFNIYFSIVTFWWAFIGLLLINLVLFSLFEKVLKPVIKDKLILTGKLKVKKSLYSFIAEA